MKEQMERSGNYITWITLLWITFLWMGGTARLSAQVDIGAARALGAGNEVTITGIITSGSELGTIRYMQDLTGGIAVYSSMMGSTERGDSVTVTGVMKDFNTLLELDPVSSVTVHTSGNELPEPVELLPSQFSEQYEGMLVMVPEAVFESSGTFARTAYTFTAGGESGQVYINSYDSPLIGTEIPAGAVNLTGPLGAYGNNYQLLPRDGDDLQPSSSIYMTGSPKLVELLTSALTASWETNSTGSTEAFYGNSAALELGVLSVPGETTSHSITLSGLEPSEPVYLQPFSVNGTDTARATVQVYITRSASSGTMTAYFNRPVDTTVSLGLLDALYLYRALDDTLINYINRAEESIECAIYNLNNSGISDIAGALNAAYQRGVTVRVVYDGENNAVGAGQLDPGIGKIASPLPQYPLYGSMHNKFMIFDALSEDPDRPLVWTGSSNFTGTQMNVDPNNVIVIQDQSLAKAYRMEFNEMFGSEGEQPDSQQARFGPDKTDNTPHQFVIGGRAVECYFSPSDGTHSRILETISTGDHSIHVATMLITMDDIGYDLAGKNDEGADVKVLLDGYDQYGEPVVNTLKQSLQEDVRVFDDYGLLHHKYMIVDQAEAGSDPLVLTGSHNWSASAEQRNDENTLVIHDQGVANAYYQEFVARFAAGEILVPQPECTDDGVTMTEGDSVRFNVLANDILPGSVTLSIIRQPANGTARVEEDLSITYLPDSAFNQAADTIGYLACLESNPVLCDSALLIVDVQRPTGLPGQKALPGIRIYPNPAGSSFRIGLNGEGAISRVTLLDLSGRVVLDRPVPSLSRSADSLNRSDEVEISRGGMNRGIYLVRITLKGGGSVVRKIVFR